MFIPLWVLVPAVVVLAGLLAWTWLLATGRNPLPFPDRGSRIFAASSPEAKAAVVALLARHGLRERFRFDTGGVLRSILWDGTIINHSSEAVLRQLDGAVASIGLVSADPEASAEAAAAFLREQGFEARVVRGVEPGLPIAFVLSNALAGTAINFRKHVVHLPRPTPAGRADG